MNTWTLRSGLFPLVILLAACLNRPGVPCGEGVCPEDRACDEVHGGCIQPTQLSACADRPRNADCSYPGVVDGRCFDGVCLPRGCGNGVLEADEACDDGNNETGDGCSADCRSDESCGNGVIDGSLGEACDDGNLVDGDGCQHDCVRSRCGDGIVDTALMEECDCGSDTSTLPAGCAAVNGDSLDATCRSQCRLPYCGDGLLDPAGAEQCDDGNDMPGDGCSDVCQVEVCGNGRLDVVQTPGGYAPAEQCDDGNTLELDGCTSTCLTHNGVMERLGVPGARTDTAIAYDAGRGRTVMFGGATGPQLLGQTWEWGGRGWSTTLSNTMAPAARSGHAMAYDSVRHRVVLFGGRGQNGRLADTWEWDGGTWSNVTPTGATPFAREGHAMAFDAVRGHVVLFGGIGVRPESGGASVRLDDTWEWDGTTWTFLGFGGPSGRVHHAMVFDPHRGLVVLHGGYALGGPLADTWLWNGSTWSEITTSGNGPVGDTAGAAYDPRRQAIVVVTRTRETWKLSDTTWFDMTGIVGMPAVGDTPAVTYDFAQGRLLLIGDDGSVATAFTLGATVWSHVSNASTIVPPPRARHAMAYDRHRARTVVFGGTGVGPLGSTWEWDGGAWTELTPSPPVPSQRNNAVMAYDTARRLVVLYGGRSGATPLTDTWTWNGATWTDVTPATGSPPAMSDLAMYYRPATKRIVLVGDAGAGMYEWNGSTWSDVSPSVGPPNRSSYALAYDLRRDRAVLTGGTSTGVVLNDTWEWDGTTWIDMTPTSGNLSALEGQAAAYDEVIGRVVAFGGRARVGLETAEIREWDGVRWRSVDVFSQSTGAQTPDARIRHAMSYDAARGRTVIYGGYSDASDYISDPWQYVHEARGPEVCRLGLDDDEDGATGCDDADCWGACEPDCPPGVACAHDGPRCGDAFCDDRVEDPRLCPIDCGAAEDLCGDLLCGPNESNMDCPGDCI